MIIYMEENNEDIVQNETFVKDATGPRERRGPRAGLLPGSS